MSDIDDLEFDISPTTASTDGRRRNGAAMKGRIPPVFEKQHQRPKWLRQLRGLKIVKSRRENVR